ncbi:MAG: SDR family oxidoreductase [Candidatus Thorarchaeota archaeon]|jgi:nucleoside-diphosphate-sugar epimerase
MKILVLGSDGQVGSSLTEHLKNIGHEVIGFDIFGNPKEDLRIKNILDGMLTNVDFVFFLAFDVGGSTYLAKYQNTYEFISNNIKIMDCTFDSLKKYGKKFIFASSQMSNMSYSPYGVLKRLGEQYTEILGGLTVKFWNVYGYEPDLNKSHVITDFILMAKNEGVIKMRTNGEEERQFLYADDCSEALSSVMDRFDDIDRSRNLHITNFSWSKIIDIAKIISTKFDSCDIQPSDKIDDVQLNKKNEADEYILEFWSPKTSLDVGISKIIKKYL